MELFILDYGSIHSHLAVLAYGPVVRQEHHDGEQVAEQRYLRIGGQVGVSR